jgi:hypothetical protein
VSFLNAIAAEAGPLFIVGSCKNAGKTTLLNFLNRELASRLPPSRRAIAPLRRDGGSPLASPVGLATIGRDGEPEDAVWLHPKPPVELRPGNLFVTVRPELLRLGDAAQLLEELPFSTALGDVVLGRAAAAAHVEIIGPDTNRQLWMAIRRMQAHGAPIQLIDGAFERRTQAAERDGARLALVVSADVAPTLADVAAWLAFQAELYGLPKPPVELDPAPVNERLGLHFRDNSEWRNEPHGASTACCLGPLTDNIVGPVLDDLDGLDLIVEDATKVFLNETQWQRLKKRCPRVYAARSVRLLLVAANSQGLLRQFEPRAFFAALAVACPQLPMVDVVNGLRRE